MAAKTTQLKPKVLAQVKAYKQGLKAANIKIKQTIVFGSQTKRTARKDSDIDLAVVSPGFGKDYHKELVKLMGVASYEAPDIEPHPFHPDDFNDRWSTLVAEIKKYGVKV